MPAVSFAQASAPTENLKPEVFIHAFIYAAACLFCWILLSANARAQSVSHDGNRWYEIEVSIFSNAPAEALHPESEPAIEPVLAYPANTRMLASATDSLRLPSLEPVTTATNQPDFDFSDTPVQDTIAEEEALIYGPPNYSGSTSVGLASPETTAYLSLGEVASTFSRHNSRIDSSGQHKLLYHAVWRQPVSTSKNRAAALAVTGGDYYETHHELEGWIRFSYNINRIDIEADLWLMEFEETGFFRRFEFGVEDKVIEVPLSPAEGRQAAQTARQTNRAQVPSTMIGAPRNSAVFGPPPMQDDRYRVSQLHVLKELRQVISNNLHYLDHPRLGMLVEVRPYELPEPGQSDADAEF